MDQTITWSLPSGTKSGSLFSFYIFFDSIAVFNTDDPSIPFKINLSQENKENLDP